MCAPGLPPGITQGLPDTRGRSVSTSTVAGDSGIARGPVLLLRSRNSYASKSTSSQRKVSISFFRHPVTISNRIAAIACADTPPTVEASLSTLPSRRNSPSVRNRSRLRALCLRTGWQRFRPLSRRPQSSASENIFSTIFSTVLDACGGLVLELISGSGDIIGAASLTNADTIESHGECD